MIGSAQGFRRGWRPTTLGWFAAAFCLRLAFGVTNDFWGDDEFQIYLIGLQFYTTGVWPLYGPDVVYTQTQVPGGLQGVLVGGPFWVLAQPEAPYVLLNLLSFAALLLLGWYVAKRHPGVPRGVLWGWMFFSPWTLDMSTHIVNTSYVMIGAIVYTVSALELLPATRVRAVSAPAAWFGLGFGALWVYQEHLSAALLLVLAVAVVLVCGLENPRRTARGLPWALCGAAVAGSTLVPTLMAVGVSGVAGRTGANLAFEPAHLLRGPQIAAQYFSFGSLELPRFMGGSTAERLAFAERYWWAAPFLVVTIVTGMVQAAWLAVGVVMSRRESSAERGVRRVTLIVLAALVLSFTFSIKAPASHVMYAAMPLVVIYAFSWWTPLVGQPWGYRLAVAAMAASAVSHAALASRNFTDRSLYRDRARIVDAIQNKDYRSLGERRPDVWRQQEPTVN